MNDDSGNDEGNSSQSDESDEPEVGKPTEETGEDSQVVPASSSEGDPEEEQWSQVGSSWLAKAYRAPEFKSPEQIGDRPSTQSTEEDGGSDSVGTDEDDESSDSDEGIDVQQIWRDTTPASPMSASDLKMISARMTLYVRQKPEISSFLGIGFVLALLIAALVIGTCGWSSVLQPE